MSRQRSRTQTIQEIDPSEKVEFNSIGWIGKRIGSSKSITINKETFFSKNTRKIVKVNNDNRLKNRYKECV